MPERRKLLLYAVAIAAALVLRRTLDAHPHRPAAWFNSALEHRWQYVAALVGWVLFTIYWKIAEGNKSAAVHSESGASRAVHVFLANVALILELLPVRGLVRVLSLSAAIMTTGVVVEAAGLAVAIWARRHLGKHWSGEITIKKDHQLIRSGPYRRLRHPIYTGLLLMYLGSAIVAGTWLAVVGLTMGICAYWRKVRLEEKNLEAAFGEEYGVYRRDSWALLPGVF